jgi:outer membrane receptor protein involved in Fe transport
MAAAATDARIAQAPTPPAATTGTVSGAIKDSSGVLQAGVTVTASGPTTVSTKTDPNGLYTLTLPAGVYTLVASKSGFDQASLADYPVVAGVAATANVTLTPITFSSLKEIGRVSVSTNRSAFNTSPASVSTISNQTLADQGQLQVQRVLDQTPGIVSDHPGTSANNASPGAITFPSIRGGLGFETASLIDGHPVAVQTFGDYVTTFLNSYVLQDIEVIKGPGANAPETYYAINGTVNFRTLDPTGTLTGQIDQGLDSEGGQFSNFRISDTVARKLGFVFDYAIDGTPGPLKDAKGYSTLGSAWTINGLSQSGFTTNAPSPANPRNINNPFNQATAVFCCDTVNTNYNSKTELAKIRYRFSDATSATVSYLGSQTYTDQNGNHVYTLGDTFVPASTPAYAGNGLAAGQALTVYQNTYPLGYFEINNEPIFQGEVKTTLGNDTILGRYYTASINRLQYQANIYPDGSFSFPAQLYGTVTLVKGGVKTPTVFDGQTETITLPPSNAYYESTEEDKLHGGSFEYDHFLKSNGDVLTFSFDQTNANTDSYSFSGNSKGTGGTFTPPTESFSVYGGSDVRYTTYLLRGIFNFGDKFSLEESNYYDNYEQRFTNNGSKSFITTNDGRYDGRLGLTYRESPDVSLRASTGSSLAPPYLALLNSGPPTYTLASTGTYATDSQNQGNIKAETAFGYDVGADFRLGGDKQTIVSTDLYLNNLRNQFVSGAVFQNGTVTLCPSGSSKLPPCSSGVTAVTVPLFTTTSLNLDDARYEGIELAIKRDPVVGFGFTTQGALIRGYPYDVSPCTYSKTALASGTGVNCSIANTNLGIVSGANFYGSGTSGTNGNSANGAGSNFNSVNNHAIPYAQGYGEIHYRTAKGGLVEIGLQYLGNNNSYNVPAFFIGNASVRFPFPNQYSFQVSADNLFNAYSGSTISEDGGVGVPLVNGQTGLTNANTVGPRLIRFIVEKKFGGPR